MIALKTLTATLLAGALLTLGMLSSHDAQQSARFKHYDAALGVATNVGTQSRDVGSAPRQAGGPAAGAINPADEGDALYDFTYWHDPDGTGPAAPIKMHVEYLKKPMESHASAAKKLGIAMRAMLAEFPSNSSGPS